MWPGLCPPIHCIWVLTIKLKFGFSCNIKYEETGYLCWSLFAVPYHRNTACLAWASRIQRLRFASRLRKLVERSAIKRCSTCKRALAKVGITISQSELVIRFKFKQMCHTVPKIVFISALKPNLSRLQYYSTRICIGKKYFNMSPKSCCQAIRNIVRCFHWLSLFETYP